MTDREIAELRRSLELLRQRVDRLTYAIIALTCLGGAGSFETIRHLLGS
jgi:hypothetical protein